MRLKVSEVEDGLNPSQVSVSVDAEDGTHFLVLNRSSIDLNSTVEVGNPVGRRRRDSNSKNFLLVELPTETDGGTWRIWVDEKLLSESNLEAAE